MPMITIPTLTGAPSAFDLEAGQSVRARLQEALVLPHDVGPRGGHAPVDGSIDEAPALVIQPIGDDSVVGAKSVARVPGIPLSVREW